MTLPGKVLRISVAGSQPRGQHGHVQFADDVQTESVTSAVEAIARMSGQAYDGVLLDGCGEECDDRMIRFLQSERILDGMPDGVALINSEMVVTWANSKLCAWSPMEDPRGQNFYAVLGGPEIMGPDFCPFHTALATSASSSSTLQTADNRYFQVHVAPLREAATDNAALVATVSDVTVEIQQQHKLQAIHQAGLKLADLTPDEIFGLDTNARIELLKDNIRHYTADLLNVEVIEIRILEQSTSKLRPLLSVGIDQDAADRQLSAHPQGNGVTGYVASTGKAYICDDVQQDPLYLAAFTGAASSLTVPLLLQETVIGTINVESHKVAAFDSTDLQFLEIFARDVAVALNTLELLVAQKNTAAQRSYEEIHRAVASPVDQILNNAVHIIEAQIGKDAESVDRLQKILQSARSIRRVIQDIGAQLAPTEAIPVGIPAELHEKLSGRRILVVDDDHTILNDAHCLLERYGCIVEAAHTGDEAVCMYRASHLDAAYDAVISAVKLPDYSGYQLMLRLMKITDHVPMALMQGFGWDPGHSIVNARQAGLHPNALLYKPFKLKQLLSVVETVIDNAPSASEIA
ncbi:MAG TPA: two-component system response regulator [Planctomycetaceae bacterium]|nr:two-component system response regulator [Planctomycetaceae bacterium]